MNQSKKLKFKTYRVPENRHYLYIQNPWPFDESVSNARRRQTYVNAVIAWLCFMVQDLCDTEIDKTKMRIFWQSTHRDLIAEIEIDTVSSLNPLLGAHNSAAFLIPKHAGNSNRTSVIYEYNYERFNSPEKTNWTSEVAAYSSIPHDFAIKHEESGIPYPAPSPSDARRPPCAKQLPGRLILGHPDCVPQTPTPAADPPQVATQPANPAAAALPSHVRQKSNDSATQEHTISPSPLRSSTPARSSPHLEADPPSEFAFTPYERPPHFPHEQAVMRSNQSPAAAPPPSAPTTKRDPYEEEADAFERLRDTATDDQMANRTVIKSEEISPARIKKEEELGDVRLKKGARNVKTEAYEPCAEFRLKYAEVSEEMRRRDAAERRADANLHVKMEIAVKLEPGVIKTEKYSPSQELWDISARGQAAQRERERGGVEREEKSENMPQQVSVKPEPSDVSIPKPRPANRRFDPFDGYDGPVKKEEGTDRTLCCFLHFNLTYCNAVNARQPPMSSPSAFPRLQTPVVKQEEFAQRRAPSHSYGESAHAASSHTYSPGVKQEGTGDRYYSHKSRGAAPLPRNLSHHPAASWNREAPGPSAFPGGYSGDSRGISGSHGAHRGHRDGYEREPSRTFSPSPRPVKRERDVHEDGRFYSPPNEPPIKRERTEQVPSRSGYATNSSTPLVQQNINNIRDPRVRARMEREWRDHEAVKRERSES
ncbi:hypothetical protein B0H19DRAFT_1169825 [Mycena capillaripes]|nr:hypothetical protein B0H19DRAFT_1169825 [Mycena capillaripes]